jgi:hypothetical protein
MIPFAKLLSDPRPHVLSCAGLGAVGLLLSVLVQPGHRRSSNERTNAPTNQLQGIDVMNRFRSRFAPCLVALALMSGLGAPGCQQVGTFLLKLFFQVARDVASSYLGKFLEEKLDAWFFNKNSSENQGGDVTVTSSDGLKGKYNGTMEITVSREGGNKSTVKVSNPRMIRDSTSSPWKLDPGVIQTARQRTEESFEK